MPHFSIVFQQISDINQSASTVEVESVLLICREIIVSVAMFRKMKSADCGIRWIGFSI